MTRHPDNLQSDRLTRVLRALAAVCFLALIVFLVVQDEHDVPLTALMIGGLAMWLGYEGVVLPFFRRNGRH